MKKIIITSIFMLFLLLGLKAQNITIPTFSNETVTLKVATNGAKGEIVVTDGDIEYTADLKPYNSNLTIKHENQIYNQKQTTNVMNQLKKQGYKLISSIVTEGYNPTYYFQKD
jgi:hypothetical protein